MNGRLVAVAVPAERLAVTEHSIVRPCSFGLRVRLAPRPAVPDLCKMTHRYVNERGLPVQLPREQRS